MFIGKLKVSASRTHLGTGFGIMCEDVKGVSHMIPPTPKGEVLEWEMDITPKNIELVEKDFYLRPGFFVEANLEIPKLPFKKADQDKANKEFAKEREELVEQVKKGRKKFETLEKGLESKRETLNSQEADYAAKNSQDSEAKQKLYQYLKPLRKTERSSQEQFQKLKQAVKHW